MKDTVATGVATAVHRQDHAGHPSGIGELEHSVGNVFRRAVAPQRLHTMKRIALLVAQLAMERRGYDSWGHSVDADVVRRQFTDDTRLVDGPGDYQHGQENRTTYKVQGETVNEVTLNRSLDIHATVGLPVA